MVNNAGIETRTGILDSTESDFDKVIAINLKSAFFGTQIAAKQMVAQGDGGVVINISSVHEDWPMPGNTPYCLSKGGMRMLTRTAGVELAPHGVRVVGVGPGAVATPINLVEMDPASQEKLNAYIPLGRMAQPVEIGSVVAFLAGPGAGYMTGTTVFADGAIMMQSPGYVGRAPIGVGRRRHLARPPAGRLSAAPATPLRAGSSGRAGRAGRSRGSRGRWR